MKQLKVNSFYKESAENHVTQLPQVKQIALEIGNRLGETDAVPLKLIQTITEHLGADATLALAEEAIQIKAQGGMMLPDNSRQRTLGGIFFFLAKHRLSYKDRQKIFFRNKQPTYPKKPKQGATSTSASLPPFQFEDLPNLPIEWGNAHKVKITVIGRPLNVIEQNRLVVLGMISEKKPSLPKGLPIPQGQTKYVVLIATKQWNNVKEAIKDEEDTLIIEGYPSSEPQHSGITVFAMNVTTRKLQAAKRQEVDKEV